MSNEQIYQKAREVYTKYRNCKELQRTINVKTIVSLLLTGIWYYVWITSAITYFSKPWATFNPQNMLMYISALAIILIPIYLFKLCKFLKFRPFIGIITDSKYTVVHATKGSNKKYIDFIVTSIDNNKKRKCKIIAKNGVLSYYKDGTPIAFFRGLEYPVKLYNNDEDSSFCYCCGTFSPKHYERCFECSAVIWNKEP